MTCPRYRYDDRVGGILLAQKLMPLRAAADVPLALWIVGLGIATDP